MSKQWGPRFWWYICQSWWIWHLNICLRCGQSLQYRKCLYACVLWVLKIPEALWLSILNKSVELVHCETSRPEFPRTPIAFPQFSHSSVFLSQMNWWIYAGAFDGFAPGEVRISWQIVARSWWQWTDGIHCHRNSHQGTAWSQAARTFGFWFSHDPS